MYTSYAFCISSAALFPAGIIPIYLYIGCLHEAYTSPQQSFVPGVEVKLSVTYTVQYTIRCSISY